MPSCSQNLDIEMPGTQPEATHLCVLAGEDSVSFQSFLVSFILITIYLLVLSKLLRFCRSYMYLRTTVNIILIYNIYYSVLQK